MLRDADFKKVSFALTLQTPYDTYLGGVVYDIEVCICRPSSFVGVIENHALGTLLYIVDIVPT